MSVEPDSLVTALTQVLTVHQQAASTGDEVMCRCDRRWRPNGVHAEHQARAVLARTDLVIPRASLPIIDPAAVWMNGDDVEDEQTGISYLNRADAANRAASALAALALFDAGSTDA